MNFCFGDKKNIGFFFCGFFLIGRLLGKKWFVVGLMENVCVFVACGFLKGLEVMSFPSCQGCRISSINSILQKKWVKLLSTKLPSLKLTCSHPKMDGWNTVSFPFFGQNGTIFRGEPAVSFREGTI